MERAPQIHAQAIAARTKFLAESAKERERIESELAGAEAAYKAWLTPKSRYEAAKNDQRAFQAHSSARHAEIEAEIVATADPQIARAIRSLEHERELTAVHFSIEGLRLRGGTACKPGDVDARLRAIAAALDQVRALLYADCDDVPAAIRQILSKIPTIDWS